MSESLLLFQLHDKRVVVRDCYDNLASQKSFVLLVVVIILAIIVVCSSWSLLLSKFDARYLSSVFHAQSVPWKFDAVSLSPEFEAHRWSV